MTHVTLADEEEELIQDLFSSLQLTGLKHLPKKQHICQRGRKQIQSQVQVYIWSRKNWFHAGTKGQNWRCELDWSP